MIYDGCFYQQIHGAAMGTSVSPVMAVIYIHVLSTLWRQPSLPHPCGYVAVLCRRQLSQDTQILKIFTTLIHTLNSPSNQKLMASYLSLTYVLM